MLPVAGDLRGLPGPAAFRSAALDAGEAVCGATLGLVPTVVDYAPSSAPSTVLWQAFAVGPAPVDQTVVAEAEYELSTAIRETAGALPPADLAGWMGDVTDALRDARRAGEKLNLPPGFPPRAVALVAQAERLQAVLDLARRHPTGGAVDRAGIAARDDALRPLAHAVRRARLAGYNALAEPAQNGGSAGDHRPAGRRAAAERAVDAAQSQRTERQRLGAAQPLLDQLGDRGHERRVGAGRRGPRVVQPEMLRPWPGPRCRDPTRPRRGRR